MPVKFDRDDKPESLAGPVSAEIEAKSMLDDMDAKLPKMEDGPSWTIYLLPDRGDLSDIEGEITDLTMLLDSRKSGKPGVIKDPDMKVLAMLKTMAELDQVTIYDSTGKLSARNLRGVRAVTVEEALKDLAITPSETTDPDPDLDSDKSEPDSME